MTPFPIEEFRQRNRRIQDEMRSKNLEALLCVSGISAYYMTGADCHMLNTPQVALLTLEDPDPWLVTRKIDVLDYRHTAYVPHERILGYEETAVGSGLETTWRALGQIVAGLIDGRSRVGLEQSAAALGDAGCAALRATLPNVRFTDTSSLVDRVRSVKSDLEVQYMREAAEIVENAFRTGLDLIRPGVRESDVASEIMRCMAKGVGDKVGSVWPHVPLLFCAGRGGIGPHRRWSGAEIEMGTQINLEMGAYRYRYPASMARTIHVGPPPPRLVEIHGVVQDGFAAAAEALRPGASGGDVWKAFNGAFGGRGVSKDSRIGYSLGIDWQEGAFSLQADSAVLLEQGQTCHLIVGIWEAGESYVFSESFLLKRTGAESFCSIPRELFIR